MKISKYKIGICWGVWLYFHEGHFNLIKRAKERCDFLVVCVSDDEWVKEKKGYIPDYSVEYRMKLINSLKFVDAVDIQSLNFTKKNAIEKYIPDFIFVGSDYIGKEWDGAKFNIPVVYLPRTQGISSTKIREKLKK